MKGKAVVCPPKKAGKKLSSKTSSEEASDVPSIDHWFRAPYFGVGDAFWRQELDNETIDPSQILLGVLEAKNGAREMIASDSIMRLHIERGLYPYAFPAHDSYAFCKNGGGFDTWAEEVLTDSAFREILKNAGVYGAIVASIGLNVRKELSWLSVAFSRWSSSSHTFVARWGELTPTLEDVCALTGLPLLGIADPFAGTSTPSHLRIISTLKASISEAGFLLSGYDKGGEYIGPQRREHCKNTFGGWLRYWYRDLNPSPKDGAEIGEEGVSGPGYEKYNHSATYLAAFLSYWLNRYIFEGPPKDGIDPAVFDIAAYLATGLSVALGPLFLGTIYRRLDMYQVGAEKSKGRYDVISFASTSFLQMFLYERFPKLAPRPTDFELGEGQERRAARWYRVRIRGPLMDIFDDESEFVARPYVPPLVGVVPFRMYDSVDSEVVFSSRLSNAETMMACSFLSRSLPYFVGGAYGSVSYNPARVARQFGFDQGVPSPGVILSVPDALEQFFYHTYLPRLQKCGKCIRAKADRKGRVTAGWQHYWKETFAAFREFLEGDIGDLAVVCILTDNELCQPRVKGRAGAARGELSRFARLELLSDVLSQAKVVATDSLQEEVGVAKRRLSLARNEPSQRMKVQRSAISQDVFGVPRVACVSSEEENSGDDLLLRRRRLWGQTKASGFNDSESEGDDGDSLEANLNAEDGNVAGVASEQGDVPIGKVRSQCVEDKVTFAPPLLQLGHPVAYSAGHGEVDGDDLTDRLPLADIQSRLPSGGVHTVSLFDGTSGLSSVDARLTLPSAGAQVSLPLVDIQPGILPALSGVATSLSPGESGNSVHDETIAPSVGCSGQASLSSVDGEFTVIRLDDGCISLTGSDVREQVLDPKVLFSDVRVEYLPRLNFIFNHRPSTFMRLEAVFLRRYLLEAFCDVLSGISGITPETSVDTFQSFQAAVAEFQRHEFEVSWLRESLSRMEAQVRNRRLEAELAEMDKALMKSALAREKAVMELERATKVLADVDLAISSLRERRAVMEAQLVSVEGEVFDLGSQIGPS